MSKRDRKAEKRKKQLRDRQKAQRERVVKQHDGNRTTVIRQRTGKGYDVQMIRDFLDHLLLELRVQHYENVKALRTLTASEDIRKAFAAAAEPSERIVDQFMAFQAKYASTLLAANAVDGTNATEEEAREFSRAFLERNIQRRDEEIGHLEALQELFDEALLCAKMPFGVSKDGHPVGPQRVHRVRPESDEDDLPDYDELQSKFEGHMIATEDGIQQLQEATVIVAVSDARDQPLLLYGRQAVEEARETGVEEIPAFPIPVASFEELQFVLAAIRKFVGEPETDGGPWRDL